MKKATIMITVSILVFLMLVPCVISLIAGGWVFTSVSDVLRRNNADIRSELRNTELYQDGMSITWVDDEAIVPVYSNSYADLPLEERLEKLGERSGYGTYISLGALPHGIHYGKNQETGEEYIAPYGLLFSARWKLIGRKNIEIDDVIQPWLQRLLSGSSVQLIDGKLCKIEDVIVFVTPDRYESIFTMSVCLVTNKGTYYTNSGWTYYMLDEEHAYYSGKADELQNELNSNLLTWSTGTIPIMQAVEKSERDKYDAAWFVPVLLYQAYGFLWIFAVVTFYVIWCKRKEQLDAPAASAADAPASGTAPSADTENPPAGDVPAPPIAPPPTKDDPAGT